MNDHSDNSIRVMHEMMSDDDVRRVVVVSAVDVEVEDWRVGVLGLPATHELVPRTLLELGRQQVVGVTATTQQSHHHHHHQHHH